MSKSAASYYFAGKLLFGCLLFTLLKVQSSTCIPAIDPLAKPEPKCPAGYVKFARPTFSAFVMVSSMSLSLIAYFIFRHNKPGTPPISRKMYVYIILPALLDALGITILMIGAQLVPMSLLMTLKGVRIVFSTFLVILIFRRKQTGYNWLGVGVASLGVSLASLSAVLNEDAAGSSSSLVGIGLVVLSEFVKSLMVISEEYLMKKVHCDPFFMLGLQGVYASALMVIVLLMSWLVVPGQDMANSWENLENTFALASESATIITILSVIPIFIAGHFMCSVEVTHLLSAVHNAIAAVLMTAIVWLCELFMHYVVDDHYGYPWGRYSALQLVGFALVVVAMLVYDGSIVRLPFWFNYYAASCESSEEEIVEIKKDEQQACVVEMATTTSNKSDVTSNIPQSTR